MNLLEEKPFTEEYNETILLKETESIKLSQICGTSSNQYFIMLTYKNLDNVTQKEFIENISKISNIDFPSALSIFAFEYQNKSTNLPTIFFNCDKEIKLFDEKSLPLSQTVQFKITCSIAFLIRYLWDKQIELDSLENFLLTKENEPLFIVTNLFSTSRQNLLKSFGDIIKKISNLENENEKNSQNLFSNIYSLCNSNFMSESALNDIIDYIISFDLNLVENPENAESFMLHLFTKSLSEKAVLQLYKKSSLQEIKINELTSLVEDLNEEVCELNKLVVKLKQDDNKIGSIERETDKLHSKIFESQSIAQSLLEFGSRVELPISTSSNGIFSYLIHSQKTPFDRLVVPSQSSGDIYCIIDPDSTGNYSSGSGEYEWVQFEFREPITVLSFKIRSAHRAFLKTWGLVTYDSDGKEIVLYKTKDDPALNGKYKEIIVNVKATESRKFRIEKFGTNWAGTNFMRIKNFELYSDDPQYIGGVFKTLIERCGGDPHKSDVLVTGSNFDFRGFHMISPSRSLCTLYDEEPPWFQVELSHGKAIVHGYRFQTLSNFPISRWKVAASNDKESWDVIHESEASQNDSTPIFIFGCYSTKPYKYFRFINASDNPDDDIKLRLRHFDIFGVYLSD